MVTNSLCLTTHILNVIHWSKKKTPKNNTNYCEKIIKSVGHDVVKIWQTSYVRQSEALRQSGTVGLRVEEDQDTSSGGDERWRENRAAQPILSFPCGAEQQPVPPAAPRVFHIKAVKTGHSKHTPFNTQTEISSVLWTPPLSFVKSFYDYTENYHLESNIINRFNSAVTAWEP